MEYHYHLQGFIYNLLRDSNYNYIHNKEGYKFFCFSNIFPITNMLEKDCNYSLLFSSPNDQIVKDVNERLVRLQKTRTEMNIGHMKFSINSVNMFVVEVPKNSPFTLITATPILIRIPREKYVTLGISPKNNYDYIYWRAQHPIDLFMSQIKDNLIKKYREFFNYDKEAISLDEHYTNPNSFPFFQKFFFRKQVSTRIIMKAEEQVVIGTLWEFSFEGWEEKHLVQFALDVGLGERNSLGFGFMNMKSLQNHM